MAHLLARLVAMNDRWARPFGDFNHRWLTALFRPIGPVKDLLNGRWLGIPSTGRRPTSRSGCSRPRSSWTSSTSGPAADIALVATIVRILLAAVTGARRLHDHRRHGPPRATTHAT